MKHMKRSKTSFRSLKKCDEAANLYFKCDHCENRFKIKRNVMKHIGNKHKYFPRPKEFARGSKM